jgi:radical SAM protein with 4Fe4S-binding SPASM domain
MAEQGYVIKKYIQSGSLSQGNTPRLGHLDIELTERCNNACMHCYINLPVQDVHAKRRELTTDQWKDILHQAADLGVASVRFTGGEPLIREDFEEIYLYTRRLGMKVILFTNARLITPALVDLLARVPPLKKLEISVYGMRAESYDAVTCTPGSFNEFHRGISLLLAKEIPFVVKSVLLPANKSEKMEFETWAATIPWMKRDPSYSVFLDLRTRRDSPNKNRLISSLRFSPEEGVTLISSNEEEYIRSMAQFSTGFMYPQGNGLFSCGAGESGCVDAYGKLQMCLLLRHPDCVYDLRHGSLREGLLEAFPGFREMKATNPDYLRRCGRCFLKGLCEQCPGKSWSEHGTLDTPVEYLCKVAHAQARFLGLLNEGELAWEIADWRKRIDMLVEKSRTKVK